mgnify:CR=1 FL=1
MPAIILRATIANIDAPTLARATLAQRSFTVTREVRPMRIDSLSDYRRAVRIGPYAWPGGYDVFAITSDGGTLCHDCYATNERTNVVWSIANKCNDGWRVVAVDATCNVDGEVRCDHCNRIVQEDSNSESESFNNEGAN